MHCSSSRQLSGLDTEESHAYLPHNCNINAPAILPGWRVTYPALNIPSQMNDAFLNHKAMAFNSDVKREVPAFESDSGYVQIMRRC